MRKSALYFPPGLLSSHRDREDVKDLTCFFFFFWCLSESSQYLALVAHPDLNMTLRESLRSIRNTPALRTCSLEDSVWEVCDAFMETGVHTLMCVTTENSQEQKEDTSTGQQPLPSEKSTEPGGVEPGGGGKANEATGVQQQKQRVVRLITITEVLCFLIARPGTKSYFRPEDTLNIPPEPAAATQPSLLEHFEQMNLEAEQEEEARRGVTAEEEQEAEAEAVAAQQTDPPTPPFGAPTFSPQPIELSRQFSHIAQHYPLDPAPHNVIQPIPAVGVGVVPQHQHAAAYYNSSARDVSPQDLQNAGPFHHPQDR